MEEFSRELLEQTLSQSLSKKDWLIKLDLAPNGKNYLIIKNLVSKFNLDCSHFNPRLKNRKYQLITKTCPICLKLFETNKGQLNEKRTCSCACANTFFSYQKHTELSNKKRSIALKNKERLTRIKKPLTKVKISKIKKPLTEVKIAKIKLIKQIRYCLECNVEMNNKYYCSFVCKNKSVRYKSSVSERIKKRVANGTHIGWKSRLKITPSYPECYVIKLFDELGLFYVREFKCGKWFIDFADVANKIALEIDGKQHNYPQRKLSDLEKDKYLVDNGWSVIRVKWKKINKQFREYLIDLLKNNFN